MIANMNHALITGPPISADIEAIKDPEKAAAVSPDDASRETLERDNDVTYSVADVSSEACTEGGHQTTGIIKLAPRRLLAVVSHAGTGIQ